ncbi:MAG: phytoene dehydrogenase [Verrucomicrobia bacterium GWF2_51_19]|nr:MAG: phytoene dehydrogenase [Verrucomicrobia bacterium GWF2_51_19]HCJ12176.1 phytoene dehydrogenase [Opitutae bacterium]
MDKYDTIVIGSGLAGLTAANYLAKMGERVLLVEQHFQLGGLAAWFKRKGGHIFDVSLHGFPYGMVKSCRKYWTREIADAIVQLKHLRFVNPQFDIQTTFDKEDFTNILNARFGIERAQVEAFFAHLGKMNFYDNDSRTTRELFEQFFPCRADVHRLLMEPITYANGSTLDDPAITYGIVFSNFMNKGVFTFRGGTDWVIGKMRAELERNGVEIRTRARCEKILVKDGRVEGVVVNGETIAAKAVLSNANLKTTLLDWVGEASLPQDFLEKVKKVRINSSSCQVYIGIRKGETIPFVGDLIFTSRAPTFSSEELKSFHTQSRTFSFYYPETRPECKPDYTIVASLNALYADWETLSDAAYEAEKKRIAEESLQALEVFIPDVRAKIDWVEVATPKTFQHYTHHQQGASFGTKFEGLAVSTDISNVVQGLYHAGSVGIIMSGWLGAINYGVITAQKMLRQTVAK